jgi:hypothetical protein
MAEKPAPSVPLSADQIAALIVELGAKDFAVREAATRQLRGAGQPAVPALVKAAQAGNLEVTLRSLQVLQSLYTTGTLADYEAAEAALESLEKTDKLAVASRAPNVLASIGEVRETRAIAAIRALGGIVKSDARQLGFIPNTIPGQEPMTTVILNKRWKGGQADLDHLEKLRFLQSVYVVEGLIPIPAVAQLERKIQQKQPRFEVHWRGGAC